MFVLYEASVLLISIKLSTVHFFRKILFQYKILDILLYSYEYI
ncbi:hypothetical protein LEP1GSC060_1223 [Leptospira weilii serovar Ranarum str. ICFT]|uniref:Uncharacterized protein n=1 Tax=Leptospira weilii serovar Ranarum str. ICFT TaxID=1218598 RepID=N1WPE6_9LEPT|nr:hypothetical protein LEP1GSC060_1223 [Leptospira weilii serovar Ranarum str. ICFT]